LLALLLAGLPLVSQEACASTFIVDAYANSSSGGVGTSSGVSLVANQWFSVSVDPNDLWNAGPLPRWSNADGLTHDLYATGSDESGQVAGTLIGQDFGLWTQNSVSAPYGKLMGKIGSNWIPIGTSYSGLAPATGTLDFYYWDSNNYDNTQYVTAKVTVPEPSSWALLGLAVGVPLWFRRRKRS